MTRSLRVVLSLLLLCAPAAAQAQFTYTTNAGGATITLTEYTGTNTVVTTPTNINGLTVTGIASNAFYENANLTCVIISAGITNIGTNAFFGCSNLTSVFFNGNAPSVGSSVFGNDTNATAYYLTGATGWSSPFAGLTADVETAPGNFNYTITNGTVVLTNYIGEATTVIIPTLINNLPVTVIGNGNAPVFYSTQVYNVIISGNVTSIAAYAFQTSYTLTNVTIPNSVTNIGYGAFDQCSSLLSVTIPNSLTIIGYGAFYDCGLTSITIPSSVTSIGEDAFYDCFSLSSITIDSNITSIGYEAFFNSGLTNITIPASVTSIGDAAFGECSSLTAITVNTNNPDYSSTNGVLFANQISTITTNGGNVVTNFGLGLIQYPAGKAGTSYSIPASVVSIDDYAFYDCSNLTNVTIGTNVVSIGNYTFQGCGSLAGITIPNSVTSIGDQAFAGCFSLTSVTIGDGVTSFGYNNFVFADCDNLTNVYFLGNAPSVDSTEFSDDPGNMKVYYYAGTSGWSNVYDGFTTTILGELNPHGSLQVTILPSGLTNNGGAQWQVDDGVLQPSGAIVLGLLAGNHTVSFTSVYGWTTPSNQTISVTSNATNTATGVYTEEVQYEFDFTTNGDGTLTITGYNGLGGAVAIPTNISGRTVTIIGEQAFWFNDNITSVTIPSSVTNIGYEAFGNCSILTAITVNSNNPDYSSVAGVLFNLSQTTLIQYPAGLGGSYIISNSVISIGEVAFQSCTSLTSVTIPSSVTSIGQYAFNGCTSLTNVTIGNGVTNIGDGAFWQCHSLSSVTIPNSVTSIGGNAFEDCTSLSSVIIGNGVTSIGDYAFAANSNLVSVYFDGNAPSADSTVFQSDPDATVYYLPNATGWSNTFAGLPAVDETALTQFTWTTNAGAITITSYSGSDEVVTIPTAINGLTITGIASNAFYENANLTSVIIPAGVTSIGNDAFYGCTNLASVYFNGNAPAANNTVFQPETNGTATAYYLPAASGWSDTFAGLPTVEETAPSDFSYTTTNGAIVITGYSGPPGAVIIPNIISNMPVTGMGNGEYVFSGTGATTVTIPSSVTSIGENTFSDCFTLTGVTIPNSVISIGDYAFYYCYSLPSVTIPGSVTSIEYEAFYDCEDLTNVTIGANVTSIGADAFQYCTSLPSITIPNSVTSISEYAFDGCSGLTNATIGTGVSSFGNDNFAFADCDSLITVYFLGNAPCVDPTMFSEDEIGIVYYYAGTSGWNDTYDGIPTTILNEPNPNGSLQVTILPSGIINDGAKWQVDGGVLQPSGATVLGLSVSNHTVSFTSVSNWLSPSNQIIAVISNTTATSTGVYQAVTQSGFTYTINSNSTITITGYIGPGGVVTLPKEINGLMVTAIASNAFYENTSLTSVIIPGAVTYIGNDAFFGCTNLASVDFNGNAPTVGSSVFSNDANATAYYLPDTTGWGSTFAGLPTAQESAQGQSTFTTLYSFPYDTAGANPYAGLILSSNILYGTTSAGGNYGFGTVFKVNTNGTSTTLYSFTGGNDGDNPQSSLIISGNTLYGTTVNGGIWGNGTVFAVNTDGTHFTNLYSFTGTDPNGDNSDGANPYSGLVLSGDMLYGTAEYGGTNSGGTVFALTTNGTGFTNLYSFTGGNDGANPYASLILSGNTLYGTAYNGGTNGWGTVFAVNTAGTGFTDLYSFNGGNDGANPYASLILSGNTLYGTASCGGTNNAGTVFALTNNGAGFTTLYNFTNGSDGAYPYAGLVLSGNTLYGTAESGTSSSNGTVFAVTTSGTGFTNLYNFTGGNDGANPYAGLILSGNTLYGTADNHGPNGQGTVFAVTTSGTDFTTLDGFNNVSTGANPYAGLVLSGNTLYGTAESGGSSGGGSVFAINTNGTDFTDLYGFIFNSDGANPQSSLILSGTTLYGTTPSGGTNGQGTVFAVNTDGTGFTNLYTFTGGYDGSSPQASLIILGDTLYGTAEYGGTSGGGTVFAIATNGTGFTILHGFDYSDGNGPAASLILSGNTLYGTTKYGGSNGRGTVFAVNTDGLDFTNLYSFPAAFTNSYHGEYTNSDGANPQASLILSGNTLYGTAYGGGSNGWGTVFALTTNGTGFTTLYTFTDGSDGAYPSAGLVLSGNTLYGTAARGGSPGWGTVFALTDNGTGFTNLHTFTGGNDGGSPQASLILSNNTLYGTAVNGGIVGNGTVYALTTNGTGFTNLYSFTNNNDGTSPQASLILSDNTFYGTTVNGGSSGAGTVFAVNINGTGFTTLYSFILSSPGANPQASLILSGNTFYGTTVNGGSSGAGVVFAVNINGTGFTNLYTFTGGNDGAYPYASLILSGNTLYGVASSGGSNGQGTVFALATNGTDFTNLYTFTGGNDGSDPYASLILSGNTLYGTAVYGGSNGDGTVFALTINGTGFTDLYSFTGGSDGANPYASLVLSGNTLYGTSFGGGNSNNGTVFAVNTEGTGFTNLYTFTGGNDGANPYAGLILSSNTLYGTAQYGGMNDNGTIFALNTNGTGFTNLYAFTGENDGASPQGNLILSGDTLYGTAEYGGNYGNGTVFSLSFGPSVQYAANPTSGAVPLTVNFTSPGTDSAGNAIQHWKWSFGDGAISTNQNPSHQYTSIGNFFPSLTVTNANHLAIVATGPSITVTNAVAPPTLQYSASPTTGPAPLTVNFTCTNRDSAGNVIFSWNWRFGDGATSTNQNPTHQYTNLGNFSPSLTVTNTNNLAIAATGPSITVTNAVVPSPAVQFSASPTTGPAPLNVNFTSPSSDSASNAIISWRWNFGDGGISTNQNPTHLYTNVGPFSPSLTVTNTNNLPIVATGPSINVTHPPAVQFTASPTTGPAPLTVSFNSPSSDSASNTIISWNWRFGDGTTSTNQNPSHQYTNVGVFSNSLIVINSNNLPITATGPSTITATQPPGLISVVITAPTNGASFTNNQSFTFSAVAFTTNGIKTFALYTNSVLIASNASSNISATLSDLPSGGYQLTAVAMNTNGASATAAAYITVNTPGTAWIDFDALTNSVNGPVTNTALSAYVAQYGVTVLTNSPGTTVAVENQANLTNATGGATALASSQPNLLTQIGSNGPVSFTVGFSNLLTQLSFTQPEVLANVSLPAWQVQAFDSLGNLLAQTNAPQIYSSNNVPAQTYTLTGAGIASVSFNSEGSGNTTFNGMLIDDLVLTLGTAATLPPSVLITNPSFGEIFTNSDEIPINVETAPGFGTVTSVVFYDGTTPVGTNTSSPFSFTWANVPNGSYTLSAVAFNSSGLSNTSGSVPVTVAFGTNPVIVTQPLSQTIGVSNTATFTVAAIPTNVSYQWQFNGSNINGATSSSYVINNLTTNAQGAYTVVITSGGQSTNSAPAFLTVLGPPTLGSPLIVTNGNNITLTLNVTDEVPFYSQWQLNGNGIAGTTSNSPAGTNIPVSFTITNARPFESGNYQVVVANSVASVESPSFNVVVSVGAPITTNNNFGSSLAFDPLTTNGVAGITSPNSTPPLDGPSLIAGKPASAFLWYNWTASFTGVIALTTRGSSFDTLMGVYTGNALNNLTSVAENDDFPGGFFTSLVIFNCVQGTNYQIAVAGYQGATGNTLLQLCPGPPDFPGPTNGFEIGATDPVITLEPSNQIVTAGATVTLSSTASNATSYQWFFADVPVASGTDSNLVISNFPATAAGNYFVQVSNAVGTIVSDITAVQIASGNHPETNLLVDKFGDVTELVGAIVPDFIRPQDDTGGFNLSQTFSTVGATKEVGEPNHAGQPGGASYWYSFTATGNGNVQFDTKGSTFNTILAVYKNKHAGATADFSSLTNVGSGYTTNYVQQGQPVVTVSNVVSNTKFYIAIDGYQGASGDARLNLTLTPSAPLNNVVPVTNSQTVVAFTSPVNNSLTANSNITVRGTIKGSVGNASLQVTVNGNAPVSLTNFTVAAGGTLGWTLTNVMLQPGANLITAQSFNVESSTQEIVSLPATCTVYYDATSPSPTNKSTLTLVAIGSGAFKGETSGAKLEVGKIYKVTAVPVGNSVFSSWAMGTNTNSLTLLPDGTNLTFAMFPNLILQATFAPNPFTAVAGTYNGLFAPVGGVTEESSGFLTVTLPSNGRGAYSAKLLLDGGSNSFSGAFDLTGAAQATVTRPGKAPLAVTLNLNLAAPDQQLTGSVNNFETNGWTSILQGYSAAAKSSPTTNYTLLIPPGSGAPVSQPGGYGYITLADKAGDIAISGHLADGSALSQSVAVSAGGNIPLYVSLYAGQGSLQGWLTLADLPPPTVLGVGLSWIKLPGKAPYADGFTNTDITVLGSLYVPPHAPANALTLNNATLTISNGTVTALYTNLSLKGTNLINTDNGTSTTVGTITPATGLMTVKLPADARGEAKGVILQDDAPIDAAGWFLNNDQSGFFLLQNN